MSIKHSKVSIRSDGTDDSLIQPSDWNEDHIIDELILPTTTSPTIPDSNNVNLFGRSVGGRSMLAMVGNSGLDTSIQPLLARNSISLWTAVGGGTVVNLMGAAGALTATGSATTITYSPATLTGRFKRLDYRITTASTTAVAGIRYTASWSRETGFHFIMRGAPTTGVSTTTATGRFFMGMNNDVSAPTDVSVSSRVNIIGIGFEGADTTLSFFHNDAAGSCTKVPLTELPRYTTDTATIYELAMFAPPGSNEIRYEVTDFGSGIVVTGSVNTDLPLNSVVLGPRMYASVGGTNSVIGCTLVSLYIESDY